MKQIVLIQNGMRFKADPNFCLKYVDVYVGKPVLSDELSHTDKVIT